MLQVRDVTKSFGDQDILIGASFTVGAGERVGLVGANGIGKSTLLKVVLGTIEPNAGHILMPTGTTMAYLPQDACCSSDLTLHEEILTVFADVQENERRQQEIAIALSQVGSDEARLSELIQTQARLMDEFERLGGYEVETQIGIVLSGLGFQRIDYEKKCAQFSGGWQMRIALAQLLLRSPNLLLLDEPTNHIDLDAVEWLEDYLRSYRGALIVVSHDRFFLDRVTQRTLELEDGLIKEWAGNYSAYVAAKMQWQEQQESAYGRQQAYLKRQEAFIERFRASARRSSQAKSREKMLEKIEQVERGHVRRGIRFRFPTCRSSGRETLSLEDVAKAYDGKTVFAHCNLQIERGERIALMGPNGAGKTTLLRILAGDLPADHGWVRDGQNVSRAYYAQHQADALDEKSTVIDEVYRAAPMEWTQGDVRDLLGAFLFSGDTVLKPIGVLSGGERSRVALAKMLLRPANLLLLDEPTNHLDIPAREMLESALQEYQGTAIVVSHDRYFVSRVANKIVEVANEMVTMYRGDYGYYREQKEKEKSASVVAQTVVEAAIHRGRSDQERLSSMSPWKIKKALQTLELEITELEARIKEHEHGMADPNLYGDGNKVKEMLAAYETSKGQMELLMARWEELALHLEESAVAGS